MRGNTRSGEKPRPHCEDNLGGGGKDEGGDRDDSASEDSSMWRSLAAAYKGAPVAGLILLPVF